MGDTKDAKPAPVPQNQTPPPQSPTVPANRNIEGENKFPGRIEARN